MELTVNQIAEELNGVVTGNGDLKIYKPAKIEEAQKGDISFVANSKYECFAHDSGASALLVDQNFNKSKSNGKTIIEVENVYEALSTLLKKFEVESKINAGISENANIADDVFLDKNVCIGAFTNIQSGCSISKNVKIASNCNIGSNTKIGENTTINAGVRIYPNSNIGANCVIHANAVIGADGFGFAPSKANDFKKIPQIGNVIIEDFVEIGSNTVIDRGTMGSTIVRKGVKLDNLIQVAHNVEIGENTVIAAQTGIAGSTKIGKNCMIGGQVGIVGHITIADGTMIQAQSGVAASIKQKNEKWYGFPAISYYKYLRAFSVFKILPNLLKRIEKLEENYNQQSNE